MTVHVLPGDAQVEEFSKTGIEGEVVVCREALVDGDVQSKNLEEFWNVREDFLSRTYLDSNVAYREKVVAEFEKLARLAKSGDINLWFEYELFCQVNMWFCVWLLRENNCDLYRVAPIFQLKEHTWRGFGGLTPDELQQCYDERLKFGDSDITLGAELWTAFQNRDYARLKELSKTESACFPYLEETCQAEIEKEIRPKEVLRELLQSGVQDVDEMIAGFRERAGVYGFGDAQVKKILNEI